jgi:hypothetical protein
MSDRPSEQNATDNDDLRERRKTWPSLVAAAAMVGFWTAVISGVGALIAASQTDPAKRLSSALMFGAAVAAVLAGVGWIAQRIFLKSRRAPIHDARNLGVLAGVAVVGLAPALIIARSDVVHHEMTRASANSQAYAIDEAYSQGIHEADADAVLALNEALGRDGLILTHLRDRSSLPDLRDRIQRARMALNVYETRVDELQATALQQVREADMAARERERWLQSFNTGFEGAQPIFDQRLTLLRRVLDLQEQQIDLLDRAATWYVGGPGVEFTDMNDLSGFNDLAREISVATTELQSLDQQAATMNAEYETSRPAY